MRVKAGYRGGKEGSEREERNGREKERYYKDNVVKRGQEEKRRKQEGKDKFKSGR